MRCYGCIDAIALCISPRTASYRSILFQPLYVSMWKGCAGWMPYLHAHSSLCTRVQHAWEHVQVFDCAIDIPLFDHVDTRPRCASWFHIPCTDYYLREGYFYVSLPTSVCPRCGHLSVRSLCVAAGRQRRRPSSRTKRSARRWRFGAATVRRRSRGTGRLASGTRAA